MVSNRLPVTMAGSSEEPTLLPSSGGLARALRELHEHSDGRWVGWLGDAAKSEPGATNKLYEQAEAMRLKPVPLRAREISLFYDGYSNAVLWPLFHYLLDKVRLEASKEWRAYVDVNVRFADSIAAETRSGDTVWIHDYQLALVPALVRQRVPGARIGYFQHIPWPSSDVFRILPSRREILTGLLGADLLGFQTDNDRQNFLHAVADVLKVDFQMHSVQWEERQVRVGVYPIGIDVESFERNSPAIDATVAQVRAKTQGKTILLGVDRLDYTKGLPRRLLAIDHLLEREPGLRERLHYIQVAVPTREKVDAYAELRKTVNELVARINSKYGSPTDSPVLLLYRHISMEQLIAMYRVADIMLVTPLRDGMNLVAKEYVAARTDNRGCLILSEFAGAASELASALAVNPYDVSALAFTIQRALSMSPHEQHARMSEMRRAVSAQNVHRWARDFVDDLSRTVPSIVHAKSPASELEQSVERLVAARHRTLLLDYDGTLVPIYELPSLAVPDEPLLHLLRALAADDRNSLHIITGRSQSSIEAWLGALPIWLHVEHGLRTRKPDGIWLPPLHQRPQYFERVAQLMEAYAQEARGAFVETKTTSLAFHYRRANPFVVQPVLAKLRSELGRELGPEVELLDGHKVLEVRLKGVSKSSAVELALMCVPTNSVIMAAGDDRTDEDAFAVLPADAVTLRLGKGPSAARLRLDSPEELRAILARLLPSR
ncbi:MAG TPA: bifunctional alpha,alpha-trehalose-phosphate synthase (UDP-forming)/trehalose-phosphatase [Polyangiales bacterium]|nr:bifunctional alpha,alpha-trehalose-phosphate synthase (UDP-forming)/trehalose-phosphatase [Polyangiales bacterium]